MAGGLPHDAVVLARGSVLRPSPVPLCEVCGTRFDGRECPNCGRPADPELVGRLVVQLRTGDGRCWVVWATRDVGGRWVPERVRPAERVTDDEVSDGLLTAAV